MAAVDTQSSFEEVQAPGLKSQVQPQPTAASSAVLALMGLFSSKEFDGDAAGTTRRGRGAPAADEVRGDWSAACCVG